MQTPIDNRMVQTGYGSGTCANIKAAGITIYTIQVNTGGDPTSTLLQNCASDPSKFFMRDRHQPDAAPYRQVSPPVNALATMSERRKRQRWTVRRPLMRTR
jgi:hypothetical protein